MIKRRNHHFSVLKFIYFRPIYFIVVTYKERNNEN